MQRDAQLTDRQFLYFIFVDSAVAALRAGWSHRAPSSWTWTTRSELELLTRFYSVAVAASEKLTLKVQESLFEADLSHTRPEQAARSLWASLESAFDEPWDKTMSQRMRVAKKHFEDRIRQIEKRLSPSDTQQAEL
jgi:hypothetical protein